MMRMKMAILGGVCGLLLAGATWAAGGAGGAGVAPDRPLAGKPGMPLKIPDLNENLFPPELVMKLAQQIGLDQTQMEAIRTEVMAHRPKLEEVQQKLATETAALNELLKQGKADVAACLAQLDKVLDDERAIKRMNLELELKVRGILTAQQIAQITDFRAKQLAGGGGGAGAGGPPEALRAKMQEVQALAQQGQQQGKDLSAVRKLMQDAKAAVQSGDYKAAEDALDQAVKLLK